jgi:serine/threonine-protein kinase
MAEITCLRCKQPIDSEIDQCPSCGERVTTFQRTYALRLIDGKYQIVDRLGAGGMGEIFKVRHIHLNELRVIKIMRPNVAADDQGLQRFLQEARTSTMIKQRNLAMLYDFAQLEDSSYYMVWEFIDGTNIQKWMGLNGPMPSRLSVEIAIQALTGLDHLHSMGLIHRDVSPENIMLSQERGGKLLVKVIDFGIAKQLTEGEGGQGLTQTGMFLGKLKYASPEQAGFLKEGEHIDARSDLYSFGIVLYEMLAGRAPFQATNPHGYILKHVSEQPPPISKTNPAITVPAALEQIVMRVLEKDRERRFATAADFANALEQIRSAIPPDAKYGLGEKMITLSSEKTLADLPKYTTGTLGGKTATSTGKTPAPTRSGHEATVLERPGPTPSGVAPTVVDRKPAAHEATVMENIGGAAPTVAERKFGPATAEATVLERQMPPRAPTIERRPSRAPWAIAAAILVVVGLGVGGYLIFWPDVTAGGGGGVTPTGTQVNQTTQTQTGPVAPGRGVLLLSASPWGDLEKIVNTGNNQPIDLSDEKRSTPTRIELDPGKYLVTVNGPNGKQATVDVEIKAGVPTRKKMLMGDVDYDQLEREMNQQ